MTIINSINKGKQPVIDTLNVTPTTSAQQITATGGTDGYSPVNVSAVTSSIDANITAGNIKSGVSILGVSGSVVELNGSTETVTPTTSQQTITPTSPSNGLTSVTVNAVTSAIDANITAGNIKDGVSILGVTGNYQGTTPTGTKNITTNGIHDVTNYASADVQVPTTAPAHYIEKAVDANGKLIGGSTFIDLTGVTDISGYQLYYAYINGSVSGTIDMSALPTITGDSACDHTFQNCTNITRVDLSNLTTLKGYSTLNYMFFNCTGITSVDLSSLTTINGGSTACNYMFSGCSGLTSVVLYSLTSFINTSAGCQRMFNSCQSLTSLSFPSLTSNSFGGTNNHFANIIGSVTGCTIHFPSNLDPQGGSTVISSLTGYPDFGGTNTVLAFDLPATNTLTGVDTVTYTRNPKYDTATALAWKVGAYGTTNFTPAYYTSGLTDPTVGTTIYSDAACTVSVTTVDTVA